MGELKNTRHERFAQLRALEALPPTKAYRLMGGTGKPTQAYKLNRRPDIKARIAELQREEKDKRIDKALVTKEMVTEGLLENIESAKSGVKLHKGEIVRDERGYPVKDVDHGAINSAWNLLGIEQGMFVRESKIRHLDDDSLDRLTLDELLNHTKRILWETSDGQIDLNTDDLRGLLAGLAEGDGQDPDAEGGALPAVPEAEGVPQPGGEEA